MIPGQTIRIPYQLKDVDDSLTVDQDSLSDQLFSSPGLSIGEWGNLWAVGCDGLRQSADSRLSHGRRGRLRSSIYGGQ